MDGIKGKMVPMITPRMFVGGEAMVFSGVRYSLWNLENRMEVVSVGSNVIGRVITIAGSRRFVSDEIPQTEQDRIKDLGYTIDKAQKFPLLCIWHFGCRDVEGLYKNYDNADSFVHNGALAHDLRISCIEALARVKVKVGALKDMK